MLGVPGLICDDTDAPLGDRAEHRSRATCLTMTASCGRDKGTRFLATANRRLRAPSVWANLSTLSTVRPTFAASIDFARLPTSAIAASSFGADRRPRRNRARWSSSGRPAPLTSPIPTAAVARGATPHGQRRLAAC